MVTAKIIDSFQVRPDQANWQLPPGLVVVFDPPAKGGKLSKGLVVHLGEELAGREAVVEVVKSHGKARSFFFRNLTKVDAPVGSLISWRPAAVKAGRLVASARR